MKGLNTMHPQHIAICGNIGAGKTTLAQKLGKHYQWQAMLESVEDNPYLRDFYQDMTRWAFHVQIHFLNSRFRQVNEIRTSKKTTVQDRTIYEDAYIFAENLHASGFMSERDYQTYRAIFDSMVAFVQPPDLLIYLRADIPKLVIQIEKRGKDYEATLPLAYLKSLNEQYEKWIANYSKGKVLIIDVNHLDFVERNEDFTFITHKIDRTLTTLISKYVKII